MQTLLPNSESIYEILNLLFGEDLSVSPSNAVDIKNKYVSIYVDDDDVPHALGVCDVSFAAYSSGAMTMMPKDTVEEAARQDNLSEMMVSNLHEVMNICSRLLIDDNTRRVRLFKVCKSEEAGEEIAGLMNSTKRSDFQVSIPRYGAGVLSFIVSEPVSSPA